MDAAKLIKSLKKQPLFKNTPDTVLAKIVSRVEMRTFNQGDVLLRQGDPSDSLFIIRKGWVKVVTTGDKGEEVILNHCGPGQIIGEMSLLDRKPRSSTVIVLRPAEMIQIGYDVILRMLDRHPALAKSLLQEMFNRVRFSNAYIQEAVGWCRYIADGNYDFVQEQVEQTRSTIVDMTKSDHARATSFLSVFFKMIENVKTREIILKQKVHQLSIQIDEAKREKDVAELTDTQFFEELQEAAQRVREERKTKLKRPTDQGNNIED